MSKRTLLLLAAFLALPACSAVSADQETIPVESSDDALRSVASGFFARAPMSGRRLEAWRTAAADGSMGFVWTRNQGDVVGVQWESAVKEPLTAAQRTALVKATFAFLDRKRVRDLKPVGTDDDSLGGALDAIGLSESSPDIDAETTAEREKLLKTLRDVARTRSVHVMTATLHDQVDMYWEGALVVIDEEYQQVVIATGGFGT